MTRHFKGKLPQYPGLRPRENAVPWRRPRKGRIEGAPARFGRRQYGRWTSSAPRRSFGGQAALPTRVIRDETPVQAQANSEIEPG